MNEASFGAATVRERFAPDKERIDRFTTTFTQPRRNPESGYALLLVFLMASIAAISLYMEVPRLAQETQRQKEQLLIERGEQYKRAIQLFMRASNNQRWPASIDELESFNGRRFLRHRYKDPMTGKEEWRLIHIQNGILTDSVNNKPQDPNKKKDDEKDLLANQTVGDYGSSVGTYGAPQPGAGAPVNLAQRRRPSDNAQPGMPGGSPVGPDGQPIPVGQPVPGQPVPGQPIPGQPGQTAGGQPGMPGAPGQPGMPPGVPPGIPGVPGQQGFVPPNPGFPNQSGIPGPPANSQNFGGTPGYPTTPGAQGSAPGYPQPGMQINPNNQSAAASLIGNLLTTPRPGGLQGIQQQGQVMGGGIAGVASKADGDSIMIYKQHQNYSEWEFIFDPAKQKYPPPNPVSGGGIGTPASQLGTPAGPGVQTGAPGMPGAPGQTPNPFGQQSQPDIRGGRQ